MRTEEFENPKEVIPKLLDKAKKYVWISTGLYPDFYNDSQIQKAITNAAKQVKSFRVLIDGNAKEKLKKVKWLLELEKEGLVEIRQTKKVRHWMIVDGVHFRLEKPHLEDEMGKKNLIVWNADPAASRILTRIWLKWWSNAEPIKL